MFDTSHVHPMIVHFPIVLIIIGFMIEFLSHLFTKETWLRKASLYFMILASISSIAAVVSGGLIVDDSRFQGALNQIKEQHQLFGNITMILIIATCLFRLYLVFDEREDSWLKWIVTFIYLLAVVAVCLTGLYGGTMVYRYMIHT
jgi:uncharacterized membrane protein